MAEHPRAPGSPDDSDLALKREAASRLVGALSAFEASLPGIPGSTRWRAPTPSDKDVHHT